MRSSEVLEGAHQCHFLFKLYLDQHETLISVYLFNNFKESGYLEILLYHTNSKNFLIPIQPKLNVTFYIPQ